LIILDASALTDWLLSTPPLGPAVAEEIRGVRSLHTLDLAQIEVVSALRRMEARRELNERRALKALVDLAATPMRRHPASQLTLRIWELRASQSAYDAAYVALAEALSMPLLTTDHRLARSTGHRARIVEAGADA
jgi:predicted nucleic acid-binding protein